MGLLLARPDVMLGCNVFGTTYSLGEAAGHLATSCHVASASLQQLDRPVESGGQPSGTLSIAPSSFRSLKNTRPPQRHGIACFSPGPPAATRIDATMGCGDPVSCADRTGSGDPRPTPRVRRRPQGRRRLQRLRRPHELRQPTGARDPMGSGDPRGSSDLTGPSDPWARATPWVAKTHGLPRPACAVAILRALARHQGSAAPDQDRTGHGDQDHRDHRDGYSTTMTTTARTTTSRNSEVTTNVVAISMHVAQFLSTMVSLTRPRT